MALTITSHSGLQIVRGDLVPGGLKTLALLRWLPTLKAQHFFYAGSVFGSGAWALAEACAQLGYESTLILSRSKYRPAWLDRLEDLPKKIIWTDPLPVTQLHAQAQIKAMELQGAFNLPLGFDHPGFIHALESIMQEAVRAPVQIWVPAVSGVLAHAAKTIWPSADIHAVAAARVSAKFSGIIIHQAPEKFHQSARMLPPYPACLFSDAKVWQFASQLACPEAVIWNVSG